MDTIIKHIIDIDKKANDILHITEQQIAENEKSTKISIEKIKTEVISAANAQAKDLYVSTIELAHREVSRIRLESINESSNIENKFVKMKDKLESIIFNQIFEINMGDKSE